MKFAQGWIHDEEAVNAFAATLENPTVHETPIGDIPVESLPKEVWLWKGWEKLFPNEKCWAVGNQGNLGSCVGWGTIKAIEATYTVEILNGEAEEFKYLSRGVCYAGSRVEVNGGKSPFRSDGSVGAWAAKFCTKWGVIDNGIYDGINTNYDIPKVRVWAANGVPDKLEPYIKQHPISNTTLVKTVEDAQRCLANGYGISVCSNQGFNTKRDANGIASPSGKWSHCMSCVAYLHIKDKLYFVIENSWGNYMGTSNPVPMNGNEGQFLCNATTFASMLAQGDTWAFAGVKGFEKKDLDWKL